MRRGGYIKTEGEVIAEMTYSRVGDEKIHVDHTWVDQSLEGQGIGRKLLNEAIEFARENELKIIPLCPYVAAQMRKHEELRDVLEPTFPL